MQETLIQWAGYLLTPITGIVSWVAASRQREKTILDGMNESIGQMQETINMLVEKNKEQLNEIIELRAENASLRHDVAELKEQLEKMK